MTEEEQSTLPEEISPFEYFRVAKIYENVTKEPPKPPKVKLCPFTHEGCKATCALFVEISKPSNAPMDEKVFMYGICMFVENQRNVYNQSKRGY
jgi:hypothetical protein